VHWRGVPVALHDAPASLAEVQSLALAHPHAPPFVTATHLVPTLSPAQVAHAAPVAPHVPSAVPVVHVGVVCDVSQQPPLHASPDGHTFEH